MFLLPFLQVRHLLLWEVQDQEKLRLSICSTGFMIFAPAIFALMGWISVITNLNSYGTDWRLFCRMYSFSLGVFGKIFHFAIQRFQKNECSKLPKLSVLIHLSKHCQET